jgi:hypothetical protein
MVRTRSPLSTYGARGRCPADRVLRPGAPRGVTQSSNSKPPTLWRSTIWRCRCCTACASGARLGPTGADRGTIREYVAKADETGLPPPGLPVAGSVGVKGTEMPVPSCCHVVLMEQPAQEISAADMTGRWKIDGSTAAGLGSSEIESPVRPLPVVVLIRGIRSRCDRPKTSVRSRHSVLTVRTHPLAEPGRGCR